MRGLFSRLKIVLVLLLAVGWASPGGAGSTGQTNLYTPNGNQSGTANGDYVSDAAGLNTSYHFWIEVPPGLARLEVDVFDSDVGRGGAGEAAAGRDRARSAFDGATAAVRYTVIDPSGTTRATVTDSATVGTDNNWEVILNATTNVLAGHWELRIDQSTAVSTPANGNWINAIGIRAHDGTPGAGGTELNVYFDAITDMGVNPPAAGTNARSYSTFPYVVSGCALGENDFDFDANNTTGQSIAFASRTGGFTQTIADANLSVSNQWNRNQVTGWTSDPASTQYGIWTQTTNMTSYLVSGTPNGNYGNIYVSNFNLLHDGRQRRRARREPAGEQLPELPADRRRRRAGQAVSGAAPDLRLGTEPTRLPRRGRAHDLQREDPRGQSDPAGDHVLGGQPGDGQHPGAGVVYGQGPQVSQGGAPTTPAIGGTGNITWNPGTLAAGATGLLSYRVRVTPTSGGATTPRYGDAGGGGNGTRAQFVDNTGNTTQARATYLFGPLCELAVTQAVVTPGRRQRHADDQGRRRRHGRVGHGLRGRRRGLRSVPLGQGRSRWVKVNERLISAMVGAPQGGRYRVDDSGGSGSTGTLGSEATGPASDLTGPSTPRGADGPAASRRQGRARRRPPARAPAASHESERSRPCPAPPPGHRAEDRRERDGLVFVPTASMASGLGISLRQARAASVPGAST